MELLTRHQIGNYNEDGYLLVEDLLTDDELDTFVHQQSNPKSPEIQKLGLRKHTVDPSWRSIAGHPKVSGMVRQLLGGKPMVVQTMYMAKTVEKNSIGVALHQDTHYIRNEPNTLMACWIAMNNTDQENGGLCVVPGSHRRALLRTRSPKDEKEHASWEQEYLMRAPDGQEWTEKMHSHEVEGVKLGELRFLTIPRGSGVFFTSMTIHGSYANRSVNRPRLAFATHYVKEGTWIYRCDIQEVVPA